MTEFNLQAWLEEERRERREDYAALVKKVDEGFSLTRDDLAEHKVDVTKALGKVDTRLAIVENTRRVLRWAIGTAFAAGITGIIDFLFNHLPKLFAATHKP